MDIFLQPGEYFVGDEGYRIRTLLGSCVSITLWHARARVGAMSHFLLEGRSPRPALQLEGRYCDEAMSLMLDGLAQHAAPIRQYEAKIFGGADMFPWRPRVANDLSVGTRNGEAARRLLKAHGIRVVAESLFGVGHRNIIFDVRTGDVWSKQTAPAGQSTQSSRAAR